VLLYETRTLDSQYAAFQAMLKESPQPPPGSRLNFSATAYCKGQTTASGVTARTGVAAADPAILPVGSVVNVATGDPKYSGVYTIMDTGPEVQGRELDLYMWSCHEALSFGRKSIDVTVLRLGWDPQASSPRLIDRLFRRRELARKVPPPEPPPPAGIPPAEGTTEEAAPVTSSPSTQ
jgi:3D (Asp-Asp-Asp) domain-containing protein